MPSLPACMSACLIVIFNAFLVWIPLFFPVSSTCLSALHSHCLPDSLLFYLPVSLLLFACIILSFSTVLFPSFLIFPTLALSFLLAYLPACFVDMSSLWSLLSTLFFPLLTCVLCETLGRKVHVTSLQKVFVKADVSSK